jgi:hypothetical protein
LLGFGGAVDAEVRWHKDGHAGVIFCREDEQHREWIARAHDRFAVSAQLSLRRLGRKAYEGALLDLTPRGCKVEFVERPKEGEIMWAKFDALDAIEATVRWVDGFHGGLEFVRPIHPAIFDSLLARLSIVKCHRWQSGQGIGPASQSQSKRPVALPARSPFALPRRRCPATSVDAVHAAPKLPRAASPIISRSVCPRR